MAKGYEDTAKGFNPGGGSGATDFDQLTDTPASKVGQAGKVPVVNPGETALEYQDAGGTPDATTDTSIPKKSGIGFVDSALSESASKVTSTLPIVAPNITVNAGSVDVGNQKLSSGAENFKFTNKADDDVFYPVWVMEGDTFATARFPVGAKQSFTQEASKADILVNPAWDYTPVTDARIVEVTFEVDTTITNVEGVVTRNGEEFFRAKLGTLTANVEALIVLDPSTGNVSAEAFGGITYGFRLESADGDVRAKGSTGSGIPFFRVGFFNFVDEVITTQSQANQRQIIRSGIKTDFSVSAQTVDTEVAISADIGTDFDVFFNANPVIDNLDGSAITVADQVHSVPNSPTGAKYFVHVTDAGVIGVSVSKTQPEDLTQVHLFEYIAVNGTLVPESLMANPTISWSDRTLEGILDTDSIRVNDLVVGSTDDATMGLTTTNFNLVGLSQNYEQSKVNPHVKSVIGQDPQNWTYLIQNSTTIPPIGADVLLDATQYDNNGVLTPVGNNQASVQLVVVEGDDFGVLYGQQLFNNYDDAILNMDAIEFVIPPGLFSAVEVCRIAIKGNATDSADDAEVTIRNFAAGSSGGSTSGFTTQSLIAPSFADARFFSELGLADTQGWNITQSGAATVTIVSEAVFGVTQDVHKLFDNTSGGIASVTLPLTASNWTNLFNFDASYSGVIRLDSADGDLGCFWGLGVLAADSPDASPDKRRFGINLVKSSTTNELRVFGTDGNALDVDVPGTVFDEYNAVTVKITRGTPPTAEVFVNGDLIGALTFNVHTGGTATDCSWSSGSTGGTDRVTYMSNYGVTIYSSDNTLLIGDAELNVDLAKTVLPPGRRDYTIRLAEAISGSKVGNAFQIVALNDGGLITVDNENPSNTKALFNGLNTVTVAVNGVLTTSGVNSVEGGNVYDFNLPPFKQLANGNVTLYNGASKLLVGNDEADGTGANLQVTGGLSVDDVVINTTNMMTIFYEGVLTAQFSLLETRDGVSPRHFGPDKEIVSINAALGTPDSGAFKGSMFLRVNGAQMSNNTAMSAASNTVVNVPINIPPFFLTNGDTIDIDYSDGDNVDALNLMVYLEVR